MFSVCNSEKLGMGLRMRLGSHLTSTYAKIIIIVHREVHKEECECMELSFELELGDEVPIYKYIPLRFYLTMN